MPELGNRANVMGPQPIANIIEPPESMARSAEGLIRALMAGDRAQVDAATSDQARAQMAKIGDAIKPHAYDRFDIIGRARISKHWFIKARLFGANAKPFTIQFRLAPEADNSEWTVRDAYNLTETRSAWSRG